MGSCSCSPRSERPALEIAIIGLPPGGDEEEDDDWEDEEEAGLDDDGLSTVTAPASGTAVAVVLDLESAEQQWGPLAWTIIEEHIARVVLTTMTDESQMIVRCTLAPKAMELRLGFQYEDLGEDFALTLFDVFGDFDVPPTCVGVVEVKAGVPAMFAALGGHPFVIALPPEDSSNREPSAGPSIRQLELTADAARWTSLELPAGGTVPFSLRRVDGSSAGTLTLDVERTVTFHVARLVEVDD